MRDIVIRNAAPNDAAAIATIYAHHVLHGTATFDLDPPSSDEWEAKLAQVLSRDWPFVVADVDRQLVGYAYAMQFRDRAAYAGTCENSIYILQEWVGLGVGGSLLAALLKKASASGFDQMIAVIGGRARFGSATCKQRLRRSWSTAKRRTKVRQAPRHSLYAMRLAALLRSACSLATARYEYEECDRGRPIVPVTGTNRSATAHAIVLSFDENCSSARAHPAAAAT